MVNYIKADLVRIFSRIPRWILLGAVFLIDLMFFWPVSVTNTGVDQAEWLEECIKWMPLVIGFIELLYVFGDDFGGKTAQIAIGTGIKRHEIVLAKWFEIIILALIDTLSLMLFAVILTMLSSAPIPSEMFAELAAQGLVCVLSVSAYMAIVLPVLFLSQGTTLALLIYVLLASRLIHKILELLAKIRAIAPLHLQNYTLTNCLNVLRSRLILGSLHFESVIGIILYMAVFVTGSILIYRKLELEF